MPNYGDSQYWEDRYKESGNNSTFEWWENYDTLKEIISSLKLNKHTCKVLNLGCGNSILCEEMFDDGYKYIDNIDISVSVIASMLKRNPHRPEMTWEVMDVRDWKYEDNKYDLAIDKSTIDALLCGNNSYVNVAKMWKEVSRVLKVNGYYMVISYGKPEFRIGHWQRTFLDFEINTYVINSKSKEESDKMHYIYLCRKLKNADNVWKDNYAKVLKEWERQERLWSDESMEK